jgi:RNA polymerase sigma-70 factor, ECF subfamily
VSHGAPALDAAAEAAILAGARGRAGARAEAFDALFRALREPILALCLHLTGRRADAEDALQEAFLAVYRALPAFRGEARLSTWVWRIALRAALRVRARRRDHVELDPETPAAGGGAAALEARDEARRLQRALASLPAEPRAVLSLFAVEGLAHREIAEILGVPEGTVWSRLHGARRQLAEALGARAIGSH